MNSEQLPDAEVLSHFVFPVFNSGQQMIQINESKTGQHEADCENEDSLKRLTALKDFPFCATLVSVD